MHASTPAGSHGSSCLEVVPPSGVQQQFDIAQGYHTAAACSSLYWLLLPVLAVFLRG